VTFVSDVHGNPIDGATLSVRKTAPSGENRIGFTTSNYGLATQSLSSFGNPGILRLAVSYGTELEIPLTIIQLAGVSETIDLEISSSCVLSDGLDDISLTATVRDRHGFTVTDGQVVLFSWQTGVATGITVDGTASLRIPAPTTSGAYDYTATSGIATASQSLQVTEGQCDD